MRVVEPNPGYPLVIVEQRAPPEELITLLREVLSRPNCVSPAVQLNGEDQSILGPRLESLGFVHQDDEIRVEVDLETWAPAAAGAAPVVRFENHRSVGDSAFLRVTRSCSGIERLREQEGLEALKGECFDPLLWEVMYRKGELAGMHLGKLEADGVGTISFMCIADRFRGKRLGRALHSRSLILLRENGAVLYRGGTSAKNLGMQAIFRANQCAVLSRRCVYVHPRAPRGAVPDRQEG